MLMPTPSALRRWLAAAGARAPQSALRRRLRAFIDWQLLWRAERHRRRLAGVTFVAITGSTGKTTTKELIAAIVSTVGPCTRTPDDRNRRDTVARTVLMTRRTHRFCIAETPAAWPGYLTPSLRIVQPRMTVVTNVGTDHRTAFGTIEAIAEEKGRLVAALPADGVAVLNADDPHVIAMRSRCIGRILTYGCAAEAMVRGEEIEGAWPDRLSLTVRFGAEAVRVRTRLCGVHWASNVLAAVAVGVAAGIPLTTAAEAVGHVEPFPGRLSPVAHADGVTFIRDDLKASPPTLASAFLFLRTARARRKIAVIGSLSDYAGDGRRHYQRAARTARNAADLVILVGQRATMGLCARRHPSDETVMAFTSVRDASQYLDRILEAGDLVMLKGTRLADHLVRIVLARTRAVSCWRERCGRRIFCDACDLLDRPTAPASRPVGERSIESRDSDAVLREQPRETGDASPVPVIVGLGNPGEQYVGAPHNVGQAVVDTLAGQLGAIWQRKGDAMIAEATLDGRSVRLVKCLRPINTTGRILRDLSQHVGFDAADCVLVYDDADLPLGSVRVRMKGSAGGHRGVASILQEFQTEAFRRVKIGVGRGGSARTSPDFLLSPFADADRPVIHRACEDAVRRVLDLVSTERAIAVQADINEGTIFE